MDQKAEQQSASSATPAATAETKRTSTSSSTLSTLPLHHHFDSLTMNSSHGTTSSSSSSSLDEEVTRSVMTELRATSVPHSNVRGGIVPSVWQNDQHISPSPLHPSSNGGTNKVPVSMLPSNGKADSYLGSLRPIGLTEIPTSSITTPTAGATSTILPSANGYPDMAPPFIEKYTSFVSSLEPRVIMDSIAIALTSLGSDYRVTTGKHKLTGVVFENNNNCTFRIHVFTPRRALATGRWIVEVQRRSGCVVSFANFYRSFVASLGSGVVAAPYEVMATVAPPAIPISSLPPLPPLSPLPKVTTMPLPSSLLSSPSSSSGVIAPTPTTTITSAAGVLLDDGTIACLMDMACARDVDIQREAVRALATATSLPANQLRLLAFDKTRSASSPTAAATASGSKLADLLSTLLASHDVEVTRCAAMIAANMGSQASSWPQLLGVLGALLLLLETTSSTTNTTSVQLASREARRQASRALAAICTHHASTIRRDRSGHLIVTSLERHRNASTDEQFKLMITNALSSLLPSSFTATSPPSSAATAVTST